MSIHVSFLFLLLMSGGWVFAQEASAVLQRVAEYQSLFSAFPFQVYENPALSFYQYDSSYIELALSADWQNPNRARIMQEGEKWKDMGFHAQSWYKLDDRSAAWGEAGYVNGERTKIRWNETSDLKVVYPYVMADTIGGDLKSETYYFKGGYVREIHRFTWGLSLDYRALMEYRKKDPRPRNVVSDLNISAGVLWKTGENYAVGGALKVRKYKQTNQVKFFSELGAYKVFHLTGLGMDYVRFAGANSNTYYKGHSWGGSLEGYPLKKQGIAFSLAYTRFSFDKILPDYNDLPLTSVVENEGAGEISWLKNVRSGKWVIALTGKMKKREGTENLFGNASGNAYPQIGRAKQYHNSMIEVETNGGYERKRIKGFNWGILPVVGYRQSKAEYISPERRMEFKGLKAGGSIYSSYLSGDYLIRFSASGMRQQNLSSAMLLTDLKEDEPIGEMLRYNYAWLSAHCTEAECTMRLDYSGWLDNKTVFINASWRQQWAQKDFRDRALSVALGMVF